MLNIKLTKDEVTPLKILCLGADSDDIEIGCGGTILRLLSENSNTEVYWIVFAAAGERGSEATASAEHFLAGAGRKKIVIKEYRDSFFPYIGDEIKLVYGGRFLLNDENPRTGVQCPGKICRSVLLPKNDFVLGPDSIFYGIIV